MKNKNNLFSIYNLRYQKNHLKGLLFNIVTISIGIAVFLCIQNILVVQRNHISNQSYAKVGADAAVVFSDNRVIPELQDKLNELKKAKKIDTTKAVWLQGSLSARKRNSMCVVRYIESEKYPYYKLESDSCDYQKLKKEGNIFISKRLASSLDVAIGDKVKLQGFVKNSSEYEIAGIVPEDGEDSMDMNIYGYVLMDIHTLSKEVGTDLEKVASKVYIKGKQDVLGKLRKDCPKIAFQTVQKEEKDLMREYKAMSGSYNGMGILTLVIAFIGIMSSTTLTIMKRQKDVCIFKVYGATNFEIGKLFLKELLFITFLGILLGEFLGSILSIVLCRVFYGVMILVWQLQGILVTMIKVFVAGLVTGVLFGIFPLLLTMQFKPVTILRSQTIRKKELKKSPFVLFGLVFLFLLGTIFSAIVQSFTGYAVVLAAGFALCILFGMATVLLKSVIVPGLIGRSSVRKVALKSMRKDSRKFAVVEVTMSICVAVIGMVLLMYNSILPSLEKQVKSSLGYDVLFKVESSQKDKVESLLQQADIQQYYTSTTVDFKLTGINGRKVDKDITYSMDCMHDNLSYVNDFIKEGEGIHKNPQEHNLVADEEFLTQYGLQIQDTVTLQIGAETYDFTITGVRRSEKIKTGHAYAYYDSVKRYVQIPDNQDIVRYYVVCKKTETFIRLLNKQFDEIVALDMRDISAPYAAALNQNLQMLKVISVLCICSAVFLVFNILSITYMGKRKEFLILGLYGAEKTKKRAVVLIQGTFLGLAGAVLSFMVSIIGALFLEVLTGIQVNYDGITAIEVVGMALACSIVSVTVLSKEIVSYVEYSVLRTE